jgi:hypothetical protein
VGSAPGGDFAVTVARGRLGGGTEDDAEAARHGPMSARRT